jgi:transposase InsO family protein
VSRRILVFNNVLDLYDRKIIGWSLSSGMSVRNFIGGLRMAIKTEASQRINISF